MKILVSNEKSKLQGNLDNLETWFQGTEQRDVLYCAAEVDAALCKIPELIDVSVIPAKLLPTAKTLLPATMSPQDNLAKLHHNDYEEISAAELQEEYDRLTASGNFYDLDDDEDFLVDETINVQQDIAVLKKHIEDIDGVELSLVYNKTSQMIDIELYNSLYQQTRTYYIDVEDLAELVLSVYNVESEWYAVTDVLKLFTM